MRVFKDKALNNRYQEEGYVKIKLLSKEDSTSLKKFAKKTLVGENQENIDFFGFPNHSSPDGTGLIMTHFFEKLLEEKLSHFISDDFKLFSATFLIKKPKSSKLIWHVDPSFYNQKKHQTPINIWAGINKITKKNGCLRVVPRSHKLSFDYEPFPLSEYGKNAKCSNIGEMYKQLIKKYAIDIPLKKGEVIIHNPSLLHSSYPNNSCFKKRIAFKTVYIDKNIDKLEFAYYNKDSKDLKIYEVSINEAKKNISRYFNEEIAMQILKKEDLIKSVTLDTKKLPYNSFKEIEKILLNSQVANKAKYTLI